MRNLLIVVLGLVCGILLMYSDSFGALSFSLIYLSLLCWAVYFGNKKSLRYVLSGLILGMLISCIYNGRELPNNKYYVKAKYFGTIGITDRFKYDGTILAVATYSKEQQKSRWQNGETESLIPNQEVMLKGKFEKLSYDPDGNLFLGQDVSYETGSDNENLLFYLETWKHRMAQKFTEVIGIEAGSLAASLVLGVKDDVLRERMDILKYLGVIHILSISGFHVNLLEALLKQTSLRRISTPLILGYALLINSVPAWRAALMKLSKGLAGVCQRDSKASNQLVFAAFVQLAREPYLLFNKSFQLTYAATLGLIFFRKPIDDLLVGVPGTKLKGAVSLSCAAIIPCVPFLMEMSSDINLSLFPANFIIVPFYSLFCVLSFFLVAFILLNIQVVFGPMAFIMDGALRVINLLEFLMMEYFSLRIAWTGASMIFLLVCLYLLMRRFNLTSAKKVLVLAVSYFILFNIYFLPGSSKIFFVKNRGQAKVIIQQNLKQYELVNPKMYKPGVRLTAVSVETPISLIGFSVEPSQGDFPVVRTKGMSVVPSSSASSDIIYEEYLLIFGNLIRLK